MSKLVKSGTTVSCSIGKNLYPSLKNTQHMRKNLQITEVMRPSETLRRLHDALLPFATSVHVSKMRRLPEQVGGDNIIWLISTGTLRVFRKYDDLTIAVAEGPLVAGLHEIFAPFRRHYFRASQDASITSLTVSKARSILTEKGFWDDVAETFAYYMRVMAYRDEHLVTRTSYTTVRTKLLEYMDKRELLTQNKISIVAYIRTTTTLSRSQIYNLLSALSKGEYIKISRGELLEIIHLPENF